MPRNHDVQRKVVAAEVEHLRSLTERLIKVALPSPALLAERMWDGDLSLDAYGTRRAFAEAVAPILQRGLIDGTMRMGSGSSRIRACHLALGHFTT